MIEIYGDTIPELLQLAAQRTAMNTAVWISALTTDLEHRLTSSILKLRDGAKLMICFDPENIEQAGFWPEMVGLLMIVGACENELSTRIVRDCSSEWEPDSLDPTHIDLLLRPQH